MRTRHLVALLWRLEAIAELRDGLQYAAVLREGRGQRRAGAPVSLAAGFARARAATGLRRAGGKHGTCAAPVPYLVGAHVHLLAQHGLRRQREVAAVAAQPERRRVEALQAVEAGLHGVHENVLLAAMI